MIKKFRDLMTETFVLLRSVPSLVITLFVIAVVGMNLLANKSINLNLDWLALDCGIVISWLLFLCLDIITKRFGPRAATIVSVFASVVNLLVCLIFFVASIVPGTWGESYVDGAQESINIALDNTFGGTWFILAGSTIAFVISAWVSNFTNWTVGKFFKKNPKSFGAYITRSYVSTGIGQFVDNLIFALIVSHFFFGWTLLQCVMCAFTGALVELLCETLFSPIGYRLNKHWEKNKVGQEYIDLYFKEEEEK